MSTDQKALLQSVSRSDIDEIEGLFTIDASQRVAPAILEPSPPPSSYVPPSTKSASINVASGALAGGSAGPLPSGSGGGFGGAPSTLTEPVWDTLKRDVMRVVRNLQHVVIPNPFREDPGKALRDWDLWGPFAFILMLALTLSSAASADRSKVFAVVFAVLSSGAVILTANILLLGGQIIFFQSLSVIGYCLFPLDVGALICLVNSNKVFRSVAVGLTLAWSSWAAYPFVSSAVPQTRKALAVYPVFLLYISIGFLVLAND